MLRYRAFRRSFVLSVGIAARLGAASSVSLRASEIISDVPPQ